MRSKVLSFYIMMECATYFHQFIQKLQLGISTDIFIIPFQTTPNDGLPLFICTECYQKLLDSHSFRNQCIESVDKLRKIRSDINNVKKEDEDSHVSIFCRSSTQEFIHTQKQHIFVCRIKITHFSPTHSPTMMMMTTGIKIKTITKITTTKNWITVESLLSRCRLT